MSFDEAISSEESLKCVTAIRELKLMKHNEVWVVSLLEGFQPINCKWVFKKQERF